MNPSAIAKQHRAEEMEKLRSENDQLRTRVRLLEENSGNMQDLTIQVQEKVKDQPSSKELEGNLQDFFCVHENCYTYSSHFV